MTPVRITLVSCLLLLVGCEQPAGDGPDAGSRSGADGGYQQGGGYAAQNEAMAKRKAMMADKKRMLMEQGLPVDEIARQLQEEFGEGIRFKDVVETNATVPASLDDLVFIKPSETDPKGEQVRFADLLGKKRIVLVVTRGFSGGAICPFCIAQTSQLAAAYDDFKALKTEVLIVYPGDGEHLGEFLSAASVAEKDDIADVRWPVVIDPDRSAVELLKISADLALPSTFLFDENGEVAFAYVGADRDDRPSVKAVLEKIKQLDAE